MTKPNSASAGVQRNHKPFLLIAVGIAVLSILLVTWATVRQIERHVKHDLQSSLQAVLSTTHEAVSLWMAENLDAAGGHVAGNRSRSVDCLRRRVWLQ